MSGLSHLPAQLPGLDIANAVMRMGGREKLLLELLQDFVRDEAVTVQTVNRASQQGDWPLVGRHAHSLKGLAINLGCTRLYQAAQAVDAAVKRDAAQEVPPAVVELEAAFGEVHQSVTQLLGAAA